MRTIIIKGHLFDIHDGDCEKIWQEEGCGAEDYFIKLTDKAFDTKDMDIKIAIIMHRLIPGFELNSAPLDYYSQHIAELYRLFKEVPPEAKKQDFIEHIERKREKQEKGSANDNYIYEKKARKI